MINIEPFRHHNNHEDGARIIPTGSSESVLPPAALWVAQSYRLTPGQGGLEGDVLNTSVSPGVSCRPWSGGAWTTPPGVSSRPGDLQYFIRGVLCSSSLLCSTRQSGS